MCCRPKGRNSVVGAKRHDSYVLKCKDSALCWSIAIASMREATTSRGSEERLDRPVGGFAVNIHECCNRCSALLGCWSCERIKIILTDK